MSVSAELLCSFELLKPLDSSALKSHIKKGRNKRQQILNSPVSNVYRHLATLLTRYSLRASSHRVFEALLIFRGRLLHARLLLRGRSQERCGCRGTTAMSGDIKAHR